MKKLLKQWLPPILPVLVWVILVEFLVQKGIVKSYIIPAPSDVMKSFWNDREEYLTGLGQTSQCAILGLGLSFVVGITFSIGMSLSDIARRAFLPYAVFFQTVPIIAIAPLLVIWFGFGAPTVIASAFIVSIFPIIASTLIGLQSTEPALVDLLHLYNASELKILVKLRIPFSLPYVFSGLKIAAGLAVIGALVGEFVGGGGIGAIIDSARTQQRLDKVFGAVIISAVLGFILFVLIEKISSLLLKNWHATELKKDKT